MSWYNIISHNSSDYTKMLYIAKISKFPKCIVLKSLTMQKGHSTISREAAFRGIPIWGISSELHSDRGTHFSGHAVKEICKLWPIMQHFHCVYQPGSSRLVNRTNGTIKTRLKLWLSYSLPLPQALPLVLYNLISTPLANIIYLPLWLLQGDQWDWMKDYMIRHYLREIYYCKGLINLLASHSKLVSKPYCSNLSSWETYTQVRKQQLDMEQQTGSK